MNVIANLTQSDLRAAVVQYLKLNGGFNANVENVQFIIIKADRQGETDTFTASAKCEMKSISATRGNDL